MPLPSPDPDALDAVQIRHDLEKGEIEQVDEVFEQQDAPETIIPDGFVETSPPKGWRRIFRRNPDIEFIREVAEADKTVLDPQEVKKVGVILRRTALWRPHVLILYTPQVERKLYWLIVPALLVDFTFYYVDKTTLSYAAVSPSSPT
jgi:hypothetical protein